MTSRRDVPMDADADPILTWRMTCAEVDRAPPQSGLKRVYEATPAELTAVAEALELTACRFLRASVTVHARAGRRYVVRGEIDADAGQTCVVTLEPMTTRIREPFEGEFCPPEAIPKAAGIEAHFDPDSEDEPMPITDGRLAIGQLVYENLALAIDPFPRKPGAEEMNVERGPAGPTRPMAEDPAAARTEHPFAGLAKLKLVKEE